MAPFGDSRIEDGETDLKESRPIIQKRLCTSFRYTTHGPECSGQAVLPHSRRDTVYHKTQATAKSQFGMGGLVRASHSVPEAGIEFDLYKSIGRRASIT